MALSREEFLTVYEQIEADILGDMPAGRVPQETREWCRELMANNVTKGKLVRGRSVVDTVAIILGRRLTPEETKRASIVGWALEFLQTGSLIADDIMDGSLTRRGAPCRYRRPEIGMIAINDAFFLEGCGYRILKRHLKGTSYYLPIMELFQETTWITEVGQLTDALIAQKGNVDLDRFTMDKHEIITEYKSGYNSFYFPIALAMILSGEEREEAFAQARDLLLPLGEFFQIQDDFLDCFADYEAFGKVGTDIQDNKASWLIIKALEAATPEQRAILQENYGRDDQACIETVKSVYRELDLPATFKAFEERSYQEMTERVSASDPSLLPHRVTLMYMSKIYKRQR
ncbi:isoprenoid synthase domain-containing protein [Piptocephalis cylindrospora]|uniref:Isoprenoid synthase domain-containing protein n=1 Tax=Piptocephalis cylindrospora TaxID=1907219 RepID=A0A4P9Y2V9_9FUNG|nr:isoprenoid synthase domain-containing protein [Piptocephalis cylindrospora]|eukprot:RKP13248.1 isoprenoid synthase domain-containing protein [Piptocephalis cylindrospora]